MSRRPQTIDAHLFEAPDPVTVAKIIETKGVEAAQERWHWCEKRTLMSIARSGRARSGIAPKSVCTRSHVLDGREAVAVEAVFILGSMAAVDVALDAGKNATRALFFKRGLDLPKGHSERVAEGMLGRRIRDGDATAVAEREAKQVHARAVCDVLTVALAMVPGQPATGRLRLPPVDDTLRAALAGQDPAAIEAVFPDLAAAEDAPVAQAEEAAPVAVAVALPDPAPPVEVPAVSEPIPHIHRRAPDDSVIRRDHADGHDLVPLAARYGISPSTLYARWRTLSLSGRNRMSGFGAAQREAEDHVVEATTQESVTPDVPVETAAPEPVAAPLQDSDYGAISPEQAVAEVAGIEARVPLDTHNLGRAVDLAAAKGLTPEQAIQWIRADIHSVASARKIPDAEPAMTAEMVDQIFSEILWPDEARGTRQ